MELSITFDKNYIVETTWDYSPMRKNTYTKTKREKLEGRELDTLITKKTQEQNLSCGMRAKLTKKEMYHDKTREYKLLYKKGSTFNLKPIYNSR